MNCPLPSKDRRDLDQPLEALLSECDKSGCGFHRSDLDTDYMPAGCVVLVVSLLESKWEKTK